jgi:hypothetical protein
MPELLCACPVQLVPLSLGHTAQSALSGLTDSVSQHLNCSKVSCNVHLAHQVTQPQHVTSGTLIVPS